MSKDRELILARRKRLVAGALSALTMVAACDDESSPQPCLSQCAPPDCGEGGFGPTTTTTGGNGGDTGGDGGTGAEGGQGGDGGASGGAGGNGGQGG